MEPAFKLLLSDEQHAQLGELTAILGQVDEIPGVRAPDGARRVRVNRARFSSAG